MEMESTNYGTRLTPHFRWFLRYFDDKINLMNAMRIGIIISGLLTMISCKLDVPGVDKTQFAATPTSAPVQAGLIDEASGMVDSRSQPGNVWVNQDSGSPTELALLGHDGKLKGKITIPGSSNRDWEEMASGPGPRDGVHYLYVGDIGDNLGQNGIYQVYRFPEPASLQTPVTQVERINFRYPDGARDAEAMFIDPQSKAIYIISKREQNVRLYRLNYPQNINEVTIAEPFGELPIGTFTTAAAISPDGMEILIRNYTEIRYWKRNPDQSIPDALQNGTSRTVPSIPFPTDPQPEAICFEKDGKGYFTLSEKASAPSVNLYYYARR